VSTRVVILGAGFAGLELSSRLSAELADRVDITLIDQGDSFLFGFSKLDVMFGRKTMDEVRIPYRDITGPGVTFRQEQVRVIDPRRKRVVTNAGVYDAGVLVVAWSQSGFRATPSVSRQIARTGACCSRTENPPNEPHQVRLTEASVLPAGQPPCR